MIEGVMIKQLKVIPDERGRLMGSSARTTTSSCVSARRT